MEIICRMQMPPSACQLLQGLVMLFPQHPSRTHTLPHRRQPQMSPLLFPTVSHLLHKALFCFACTISPPPLFFPPLAVVLSFKCTPSDLACNIRRSCVHFTLFQSPIWLGFVWYWSSGCKILHDDYIDLYLWLISSFTVIMVQH